MPPASSSTSITRFLAVGIAGFCTFLNLYAPQALLPMLAVEFGATAAEVSHLITASTIAVAVTAPFTGAIADVLGRKRVITAAMLVLVVPGLMMTFAPSLDSLIALRFAQGLVLPPIFAVTIAYISEEWPPDEAAGATGIYLSGSSIGGFSGRFIAGVVADLSHWRLAFALLALISLVGAIAVLLWLPRERAFVRSEGLRASARQMLQHLRNPVLLATFAVGFGVLFNFVATFTYISFHLAAAPYLFSASALGAIFATYLVGSVVTPWIGIGIARFGRARLVVGAIAVWAFGVALTLATPMFAIILGLAVCASCGMVCQAISSGHVAASATAGRSSAVGLYVACFYMGGSSGAALGGVAWTLGQWPACAALVAVSLAIMALIVLLAWKAPPGPGEPLDGRAGAS